jgi:hypothetical protein
MRYNVQNCITSAPALKVPRCVHTLVQYANYGDPVVGRAEIDDMSPHPAAAISFADMVAEGAELRAGRESSECCCEIVRVAMGLVDAPFVEGVQPNTFQVVRRRRR